jgi:hypothetical protein
MKILGYRILTEEEYKYFEEDYFDKRFYKERCENLEKIINNIRIDEEEERNDFFNNILKMIDEGKEVYFWQNHLNDYNSYFAFHDTLKPATKITLDQYGQLRVLSKVKSNLIEKEY